MAIYLCSDIHGDLKGFKKLLEKIKYNIEYDHLYILGDVFDRGEESLELFNFVTNYVRTGTMTLLKGNHELFVEMYLKGQLDAKQWIKWGGKQSVIDKLNIMSEHEKDKLLEFIEKLPYYIELTNERYGKIILTHSGLDADNLVFDAHKSLVVTQSIEQAVHKNEFNALVSMDIHYMPSGVLKRMNAYMIVGHVPTERIREDKKNKIFATKYYMDIDTGCSCGGVLSAYCLDDKTEYYVI